MKIYFIFLVISILLGGCARPQDKILGTWKTVSGEEDIYFTFQDDNDLNVNDQILVKYFVTEDKKIVIGDEGPVPYSIKDNILSIKQESFVLTLTKVKQ